MMCNLVPPLNADAVVLVERKRVLRRLDSEQRSKSGGTRLHRKLEVNSARVKCDRTGKPSEIRRVGCAVWRIPMLAQVKKAVLAERRPNRESKRFGIIVNRYLDVAANKKVLLVHDALIGGKV